MDLEAARKTLSKRSTFSPKHVAFFGVVVLCLVAGVLLRFGLVSQTEVEQNVPVAVTPSPPPVAMPAGEATKSMPRPEVEQNTPAAPTPSPPPATTTPAGEETGTVPRSSLPAQQAVTAPTEQADPTGETVSEPELPDSGVILVARQPVEVRASPSSSAPTLYGFPAGRPFRVIGREGGFAHIQDLRSRASGWIDEAALALPPRAATTSAPVQPRAFSTDGKPNRPSGGPRPRATQKDGTLTADSEAGTQPDRKRPGLFGRGGLFGGIFRNPN
jgi:hypothetical protein